MHPGLNRIKALDGLRTLAVIGVLWTHVWMFFDNIPWKVGSFDMNRVLSIGRNGVDLFFVISGFCMYLMYHKKAENFSIVNYTEFLVKRWRRIAPAFYVLVIIEALVYFARVHQFPFLDFFAHITFSSIFLAKNEFSPHYWSLATEWQFYLVLPLLFLLRGKSKSVVRITIYLILLTIAIRVFLYYNHIDDILNKVTVNSDAIWYRFAEFGFGIIAAVKYLDGYKLPKAFSGLMGVFLGFGIAYAGRICMLTEFVTIFKSQAYLLRSIGEPLMTFGFAIILYNVITTQSIVSYILSSKPFLFIGKISYSFYLWHWLIASFVSDFIINSFGVTLLGFNLAFIISALLAIPVSMISYNLLEAPYFKKAATVSPGVLYKEAN